MTFEGVFRLDGKFEGEIFESGTLIVGETAVVKGKIGVNTLIINGQVEGEVYARGRVEIHSTGNFMGPFHSIILSESLLKIAKWKDNLRKKRIWISSPTERMSLYLLNIYKDV
jgi:hypothetical protein